MNATDTEDVVMPANDHEGRARCAELVAEIKRDLATLTSPEDCLYDYANLVEALALLGEVAPTLESVAPLMQIEGVDMAKVRAHVAQLQQRDKADFQREMALWAAQREVEQAIKTYGQDSLQVHRALAKGLKYLPADVLDDLSDKALKMGLMPEPAGYTADNKPVFAVADLAMHLGLDEDEINVIGSDDPSLMVDASCVHRVQ